MLEGVGRCRHAVGGKACGEDATLRRAPGLERFRHAAEVGHEAAGHRGGDGKRIRRLL